MIARFYLDEDIPLTLALQLWNLGHDAVHVRNLNTTSRTDGYHLRTATNDDRIMVVHNGDDYYLIHDALHRWLSGPSVPSAALVHRGILHIPQKPRRAIPELSQLVNEFLTSGLPSQNRFYSYDANKGWVERIVVP